MKYNIYKIMIILICMLFIIPQFSYQTEGIGQHEIADGTVIGYIENATNYEGLGHIFYADNDSYVIDYTPDSNNGGSSFLYVRNCTNIYDEQIIYNSMIKFNIDSIDNNVNVTSSTLYLYYYGSGVGNQISLYRNTQIWNENTVTWNTRPSFESVKTDYVDLNDVNVWEDFDVTDDMQGFINGTNTNYGWTLNTSDYDFLPQAFRSKEHSDSAQHPFLTVEYTVPFNVTRDVSSESESNTVNFTCANNISEMVNLKIPVSNSITGIVDVTNNTGSVVATEVNDTSELTNNTYWYDSANQYVYIRTINLTYGMTVNWTINCSYGITFNIPIPTYKEVGEDISMSGRILNSSGVGMNVSAKTHIYNSTGVDMITPVHEWYCLYGNYECTIPTSGLIPGEYRISIEITDPETGIIFKYGDNLYLSFETPDGVYSDALVYFNFYNTNIGLGLIPETFKVYIDDTRIYENTYYGYTGETINITIRDYYDFIMTSTEYTIISTYTGLNFGLTFHEYDFTNENDEYFYASFLKSGADRWYERVVASSGGQKSFMLPSGNYTVRVYNYDNSSYITWMETVNRSKAYLIGTDGVSLIIQGQSVIIGEFLELNADLDNIFMPDVQIICRNPPIVFSMFDPIGMELGGRYYSVCPPINVIAETRYEDIGIPITSSVLVPSNGTTENGSITILEDIIDFNIVNGTVPSWINITYTSNGTLIQNTTSMVKFYPFGADVTINASTEIRINRETRFNQLKKFDWDYYPGTDNPGWIIVGGQKRVGYHRAGLEIYNSMNTIWYNVHVYAGFSTDTPEPDDTTVRLTDIDNGNLVLEDGENYMNLGGGIAFRITGSLNASETRSFIAEYYSSSSDQYHYGNDIIHVESYETYKRINDKLYNYFKHVWINSYAKTYRGSLKYFFDFPVETGIKQDDVIVYDAGTQTNITDFIICDEYLEIGSNAVGDVNPGGGKTYEVYFKFDEYPGSNVQDARLNTPLFKFGGVPISVFLILIIVFLFMAIFGALLFLLNGKNKKNRDYAKALISIGMVMTFLIWIMSAMGL